MKRRLAREIVTLYHSREAALKAEAEFDRVFVDKETPDEMDTFAAASSPVQIVQLLYDAGLASSKGEARRLVNQGAVRVDGKKITDINYRLEVLQERVLKVGKRRFLRVQVESGR